jgi:hypothetical protein
MANAITALGLVKLFEDFTNSRNIKLVGTTTIGGSTIPWESTSEPVNFGVQPQAGQARDAQLIGDVLFEITFTFPFCSRIQYVFTACAIHSLPAL